MMVRFATTCDRCGTRSEEYTAWPTCRECMDHVCPACQLAGSLIENDGRARALCVGCEDE